MKKSDWIWGVIIGVMGIGFIVCGIMDCLHLLDKSNSGYAVGYLCAGIFSLLGSYFGFLSHNSWARTSDLPPSAFEEKVWSLVEKVWSRVCIPVALLVAGAIIFAIFCFFSSLSNSGLDEKTRQYIEDGRQRMKDAEKAEHYRKPEVGDYVCPHCRYVFGKFIPRKDPTFIMPETTTTCPGCGKKLNNEFKR